MTGTWFTSDPHFGHRLVANHRGFGEDTEAHDKCLIENWVKDVQPHDVVWILGDLSVSHFERPLRIINDLPGRKRLIFGNHDHGHPMHRNAHRWLKHYLDVFEYAAPFGRIRVDGTDVLLSHFPYETDRHEVRYLQYRLRNEGRWLLHGHTHAPERWTSSREIHVGVDAWGMHPVNLGTIATMMKEGRKDADTDHGEPGMD